MPKFDGTEYRRGYLLGKRSVKPVEYCYAHADWVKSLEVLVWDPVRNRHTCGRMWGNVYPTLESAQNVWHRQFEARRKRAGFI